MKGGVQTKYVAVGGIATGQEHMPTFLLKIVKIRYRVLITYLGKKVILVLLLEGVIQLHFP